MTTTTARLHANLLQHSSMVLWQLLQTATPADARLHTFFRANKQLGARDRGFIAETVYGCLRQRLFLEYALGDIPPSPDALVVAYLVLRAGYSARVLEDAGITSVAEMPLRTFVEKLRTRDVTALPLSARTNLPAWLLAPLLTEMGEAATTALADALNQPANVDLRVNTLKCTRELAAESLTQEGYPVTPTPYSPVGLRRDKRGPLNQTTAFKQGWIEIQDEGSQLLAYLLEIKARESIVDFCAGAGGKTLQLGNLLNNTGSVTAMDVSEKRLAQMKPRLRRAGLDNIRLRVIRDENDVHVKRQRGKIDRVLVDAPCSGSGTLRRNPDIKSRDINLAELNATQQRILDSAAKLLKPGGRLVYATCSVLRCENEQIVENFLQQHPEFQLVPVNPILERQKIPLTMAGDTLRLFPHEHGTDGFFAAVIERGQP